MTSSAARLVGPVYVGAGVEVGAAELGPNVTLMPGSRVEGQSKLAHVMLLDGAEVGRGCEIEYAVIEEAVQVAGGSEVKGDPGEAAVVEEA